MRYPVTRALIDLCDQWVTRLAAPLSVVRVHEETGGFHWEFSEHTPRALIVAKAVRMVSAIRVALFLAENTFLVESAALLRMVSDFATEIIAVAEGEISGKASTAQQTFVRQFFSSPQLTLEAQQELGRQSFVSREELMKALVRLSDAATGEGELHRDVHRVLNRGYDGYVHGAYLTAMELYHGGTRTFMLRGTTDDHRKDVGLARIAGKLHEVVCALEMAALAQRNAALHSEVRSARHRLEASNEEAGYGV